MFVFLFVALLNTLYSAFIKYLELIHFEMFNIIQGQTEFVTELIP